MVSVLSLWLPILLSAVFVFILSSIIHMMINWHRNDFKKVPSEDELMDALQRFNIPPGNYSIPRCTSMKEMNSPEFKEKMNKGPVAMLTMLESGQPKMAGSLILWFFYLVLVGIFAGYIAGRALPTGAHYLEVFRFVGCTAFAGYSLGLLQESIWYKRNWCATLLSMFDGLLYALLTAGVFGWLWPSV